MPTSKTKRSTMKPYQERMEAYIQAQTMVLWERGQLPKRRPWRGERATIQAYIPTGIIDTKTEFFEDM